MENETFYRYDEVNDHIFLLQRKNGLTFGTDALLLSAYVDGNYKNALELGAGTGVISLLLLRREKVKKITALEVQHKFAKITECNAQKNGYSDRMKTLCVDLRDYMAEEKFEICFSNPPYMRSDSGKPNTYDEKNIARHEVKGSIFDFCQCASKSLKYGGSFCVVYRTDRLSDLFFAMRNNRLEPKRITFVHANQSSMPSMALIEAKLGCSVGLKVTPPLILYTDENNKINSTDYEYILQNGAFPEKFSIKNKKKTKESSDGNREKPN